MLLLLIAFNWTNRISWTLFFSLIKLWRIFCLHKELCCYSLGQPVKWRYLLHSPVTLLKWLPFPLRWLSLLLIGNRKSLGPYLKCFWGCLFCFSLPTLSYGGPKSTPKPSPSTPLWLLPEICHTNPTIIIMKLASYTLPKEGPKTM